MSFQTEKMRGFEESCLTDSLYGFMLNDSSSDGHELWNIDEAAPHTHAASPNLATNAI
jgi:hypothetical protein